MSSPLRHRRNASATWVAVMIALATHIAVVAALQVGTAAAFGRRPLPPVSGKLPAGCASDVALAASARIALCFAPWQSEPTACLSDAKMSAWVELSDCQAEPDSHVAQVAVIDDNVAARMRSIDPASLLKAVPDHSKPQPKPDAPEERPKPMERPAQVVETAKPQEQKAPDNARFVAEYDTSVSKQTVARGAVHEPMVAHSKPSELAPKQAPQEDAARTRDSSAPNAGLLAMRSAGSRSAAEPSQNTGAPGRMTGASGSPSVDGFLAKKGQGAFAQHRLDGSESTHGGPGVSGRPSAPNLKATAEVLERAVGGGSVDHLEDVETGDSTALNAKRWVYASFFNRLKRQVAQNWDPVSVWRRTDPSGQIYGLKTRTTEVRVSLSTEGRVAKIVVTTASGVDDLDDEALRAFRAAGPFPNPPHELAGADHLITFAFAFYFEIGAPRTSWRVIRSM